MQESEHARSTLAKVESLVKGIYKPPQHYSESNIRTIEYTAVKTNELNAVEVAYLNRNGPPTHRIHPDQEVNGQNKVVDVVVEYYEQ